MEKKLEQAVDELIFIGMNNNVDLLQLAALFRRKAAECEKQMAELPA